MIDIQPFANGDESFTSEEVTVENGTESVFLQVAGSFGRNRRDLEALRNVHEFIGRLIAEIERTHGLPDEPAPSEPEDVVIVDNPLLG